MMMKITIGIQFNRLDNVISKIDAFQKVVMSSDNYKIAKAKLLKENKIRNIEINQIISKIQDKFGTKCEKFCLGDKIIEGFFDVYYTEEYNNYELQLKEILHFLSCLKNKYLNVNLSWYILENTFSNDYFD